jgi:hypothetical protein
MVIFHLICFNFLVYEEGENLGRELVPWIVKSENGA